MSLTLFPSRLWLVATAVCIGSACGGTSTEPPDATATPVYNQQTGRLEQLVSDRDGDGKIDTRAFMDGTRIVRVEIDRDGDGQTDRWEFYEASAADPQSSTIEKAEEASGANQTITRREFYVAGVLQRVEEDTDLDGVMDKWETYQSGRLTQVDLDFSGRGRPTRRMIYGADGSVARMEADPDGDGVFEPVVTDAGGTR